MTFTRLRSLPDPDNLPALDASTVRLIEVGRNLPNPTKSQATATAHAASAPARKRRRIVRLMRCRWT